MTQKNNNATHLGVKQQALGPAMHTETYSQTNVTLLYSSIFPSLPPPCSPALTPNEVYWAVHVICPLPRPVLS